MGAWGWDRLVLYPGAVKTGNKHPTVHSWLLVLVLSMLVFVFLDPFFFSVIHGGMREI